MAGVVSVLAAQSLDLVGLVAAVCLRVASVGFLRLATLALAQAIDLATFSVMVTRHGAVAEANPIVSNLFVTLGLPAVALAKLALVVLVGALFLASAARGGRGVWSLIGGLPLALAIAAGIIGGITNTAVLLG
jgi:hypothetical protein